MAERGADLTPRIFVEGNIDDGATLRLRDAEAHYLRNVLRRRVGDEVRVFNGECGEFEAKIVDVSKTVVSIHIDQQRRKPEMEAELLIAFAPVKRIPTEFMLQKCTELGATGFQPVITERTNSERLRIDRLQAIAREAAEQCERLTVPVVAGPITLAELVASRSDREALLFCDEGAHSSALTQGDRFGLLESTPAIKNAIGKIGGAAISILVGPEGGFSHDERQLLRAEREIYPISLGPRILRADTAAIVATALWQSERGDLSRS